MTSRKDSITHTKLEFFIIRVFQSVLQVCNFITRGVVKKHALFPFNNIFNST